MWQQRANDIILWIHMIYSNSPQVMIYYIIPPNLNFLSSRQKVGRPACLDFFLEMCLGILCPVSYNRQWAKFDVTKNCFTNLHDPFTAMILEAVKTTAYPIEY